MAESKWLMYNNKALMYGGKGIQHGGGSSFDLYFDLGDQYTLDTKTAAEIPLAGNPLAGATRRYIAFYMDATLRDGATNEYSTINIGLGIQFAHYGGGDAGGFGVGPGTYALVGYYIVRYPGMYLRGIYNPAPFSGFPGNVATAVQIDAPPIKNILIKIICDTEASNEITVQYKEGGNAWQVSSSVGSGVTVPFDIHGINTLTSFARSGQYSADPAFSATDFKCAGFDTLADAEAWLTA